MWNISSATLCKEVSCSHHYSTWTLQKQCRLLLVSIIHTHGHHSGLTPRALYSKNFSDSCIRFMHIRLTFPTNTLFPRSYKLCIRFIPFCIRQFSGQVRIQGDPCPAETGVRPLGQQGSGARPQLGGSRSLIFFIDTEERTASGVGFY